MLTKSTSLALSRRSFSTQHEVKSPFEALYDKIVHACSRRAMSKLQRLCRDNPNFSEMLVVMVSAWQRKQAEFMLWAMKEPSKYSVKKVYDGDSASRTFAYTVCPGAFIRMGLFLKYEFDNLLEFYKEGDKAMIRMKEQQHMSFWFYNLSRNMALEDKLEMLKLIHNLQEHVNSLSKT